MECAVNKTQRGITMVLPPLTNLTLVRTYKIPSIIGVCNTAVYSLIEEGLLPPTFPNGKRSTVLFQQELEERNAAVAVGKSDARIRDMVKQQVERRKSLA